METLFPYRELVERAAALLVAAGADGTSAEITADGLVEADARGLPSHGLMLLPMYLDRIRAGSIDPAGANTVVNDLGAAAVFDSHNGLGQVTAQHAMASAIDRAKRYGIGVVVCRNTFHFGGAYRYARLAADAGMIGIAAANTRPLMPAPGGARAVVGNNPVAIAAPLPGEAVPLVFDAALSEAALGKIRLAAAADRPIPGDWATDAVGNPTTDPHEAIAGMLLPAGGSKGFGLALMIDVLSGVLSGGGFGDGVRGLYADAAAPYGSAQFFLAIDAVGLEPEFAERTAELVRQIAEAPMVDTATVARVPGARGARAYRAAREHGVTLPQSVVEALIQLETTGNEDAR